MSLTFLYTHQYQENNPPDEWKDLEFDGTLNETTFQSVLTSSELTFTGPIASFIMNDWVPNYGVHNGLPMRVVEDGQVIVFDGFLVISERTINSKLGPIILKIPIRDLTDNLTSLDRVSIFTHSLLRNQGYINSTMYYHLPTVFFLKKGFEDRAFALKQLVFTVLSTFLSIIQDMFSAISDIIGASVAIGVVEFWTLIANVVVQVLQLSQLVADALVKIVPLQFYNNVCSIKDIVEAAFAKINKIVDWGIIEDEVADHYVLSTGIGENGIPFPNNTQKGELNVFSHGYIMDEYTQEVEKLFNTRFLDRGNTVWIKTKKDPDWNNYSSFEPEDVVVEQTQQYQNGYYRDKTEDVFATERFIYEFDEADAWTLTEKSGDSHEVHRELITELDPRMNTLKGVKDTRVQWAMAVRYEPITIITDLINEILGTFGANLSNFQSLINQWSQQIPNQYQQDLTSVLNLAADNSIIALKAGGLLIETNTWGRPKIVYAKRVVDSDGLETKVLNIPSNFKDVLGAANKYNEYYTYDSPAIEYNFQGQRTEIKDLIIPFSIANYQLVKNNPYFLLGIIEAKLSYIKRTPEARTANVDIEKTEPFDNNITEEVIT